MRYLLSLLVFPILALAQNPDIDRLGQELNSPQVGLKYLRTVSDPINHLVDTANQVSRERDYSLRATKYADEDEPDQTGIDTLIEPTTWAILKEHLTE